MLKYLFVLIGIVMTTSLFAAKKVEYRVSGAEYYGKEKLSLDIRVSRKLSKAELMSAARAIYKSANGVKYKFVFITYYLPGMKVGAGAWATTHFKPRLDIDIMDWMLEYNPPRAEFMTQ